jgi:hypothetical protein
MFDPGPHFGLGTIFRPLDLIDAAAVAVAAIDKILAFGACCRITARQAR